MASDPWLAVAAPATVTPAAANNDAPDVPEGATDVQRDESGGLLGYRDAAGHWTVAIAGTPQPKGPANTDGTPPTRPTDGFDAVASAPTSDAPAAESHDDPSLIDQVGRGVGLLGRAAVRGAGQLTDIVSAPLKAVQDIGNMIAPDYIDPAASDKYTQAADDLGNSIGLPVPQNAAERVNDAALSGATTGLLTAGTSAAAAPASTVAKLISGAPALEAIGGAGSGAGGEIAKEEGAGPWGQLAASLGGGFAVPVAGAAVSGAAKSVAPLITNDFSGTTPSDLLAAFQRQQVEPMAAQVGKFWSKMMTGGAKATLGGIPLAKAAERSIATARAAKDRIAQAMGLVVDDTGAGQAARRGMLKTIDSTALKEAHLYEQLPIDNNVLAESGQTRQALTDVTKGFESNPELSHIWSEHPQLKRTLDALTPEDVLVDRTLPGGGKAQPIRAKKGGQISWGDMKRLRTIVGGIIGKPSLTSDGNQIAAMRKLYAGLSEDMKATAAREGALKQFQRANTYSRARSARIENTLKAVLGNDYQKSPEDIFKHIQKWSREGGDSASLARLMRSIPEEEAATVRATLFSRMGVVTRGRQDMGGEVFSPNDFASNWAAIDHRAKSVLFPGTEYRADLDDIARIADHMKASEKFANTSGTALAERVGKNLLGATAVSYILHPTAAIGGEGIGYGAGMLLGSPRVARWIASAGKKPNGPATLAHINRLSSIAVAEPEIANEVLALQQRLASAFQPQSLAAQPEDHKK